MAGQSIVLVSTLQPLAAVLSAQGRPQHAVVLLEPSAEIQAEDLPFLTMPTPPGEGGYSPELTTADASYYDARDQLLAKFDRQFLTRVIAHAGGNLSKAARRAGIDRTTFYRLMERHGLQRDAS